MADWKRHLARFGGRLDDRLDALKFRLRKRLGTYRRLQIAPYRGFGNSDEFYIKGRVLAARKSNAPIEKARIWHNVLASYRRFNTVEVPNAVVRVRAGEHSTEVSTDSDGYFELHLKNEVANPTEAWHKVDFEILSPGAASGEPVSATGFAIVPPSSSRFGIVSDIDDTIIVTNATNLLKVARATFLRNARGRVAFPGVGAFYRALQAGINEGEFNPVFYVSSGPWNLYDLLVDFMELNQIPAGPILLQDYGFDETKFLSASHLDHKMAQIRKLLETYPELPFILIGDSGQKDPEIYRKVLEEVPNRIKAVYIRDVTGEARGSEIRKLAEEAKEHGGELLLVKDSLEAAKHAVELGLISAAALPEIAGEKRADEAEEPDHLPRQN